MGGHRQRDRRIDAGELLEDHHELDVAEPHAAELLGEEDAEQAHLGELGDHLRREGARGVVLLGERRELPLGEGADRDLEALLVVGQREVHAAHVTSRSDSWGPGR